MHTEADMLIKTQQVYEGLYIVFDGLALIITHVCALKMNSYLRQYIRKVQEKQLKAVKDQPLQYSITHSLFLIKSESFAKSNFMPRIPGTGLSISLNSPGFMLSIIISVFALIGSLIAFWIEYVPIAIVIIACYDNDCVTFWTLGQLVIPAIVTSVQQY